MIVIINRLLIYHFYSFVKIWMYFIVNSIKDVLASRICVDIIKYIIVEVVYVI